MSEQPGRAFYLGPKRTPAPLLWLAHLNRWIALGEGAALGVLLSALIILATWQCLGRNFKFLPQAPFKIHDQYVWVDSFIRHAVFLIGFLGAAFATHVIKHLRVDAVSRLMPVRLRLSVRIVTTLFACGVCWLMLKAGWSFHADIVLSEKADPAELINRARGSLALPVGFALILVHFVVQIVLDICWVITNEDPPAEWLAEAHGGELHLEDPHAEPLETATVLSEEL